MSALFVFGLWLVGMACLLCPVIVVALLLIWRDQKQSKRKKL
jgi:hypothetical protein